MPAERIVFFDGICGLCNRSVDRLLRVDRNGTLRFAPLQGSTARLLLPSRLANEVETVVYLRDGRILERSDAALRILIDLGGYRRLFSLLLLCPRALRDAVYGWVARNRYDWFGMRDSCRLPDEKEQKRFLP